MDRLRRAVFGRLGPRWKSQDHHRGRIDLYLRDGTGSPAAIRFTTRAAEYGVARKERLGDERFEFPFCGLFIGDLRNRNVVGRWSSVS